MKIYENAFRVILIPGFAVNFVLGLRITGKTNMDISMLLSGSMIFLLIILALNIVARFQDHRPSEPFADSIAEFKDRTFLFESTIFYLGTIVCGVAMGWILYICLFGLAAAIFICIIGCIVALGMTHFKRCFR